MHSSHTTPLLGREVESHLVKLHDHHQLLFCSFEEVEEMLAERRTNVSPLSDRRAKFTIFARN